MDTYSGSNFVSPASGEAQPRPNEVEITVDIKRTIMQIRGVLKLPESGSGAIICVAELIRDLRTLAQSEVINEWIRTLSQCIRVLTTDLHITEAQDRHTFASTRHCIARLFLTPFATLHSSETKNILRQVRAILVLGALAKQQPLADSSVLALVKLASSKTGPWFGLAQSFQCDRNHLITLRTQFQPESDVYQFVTSFLGSVDSYLASPPPKVPNRLAPVFALSNLVSKHDSQDKEAEKNEQDEQVVSESAFKETDLIADFNRQQEFATPKTMSGIANLWDGLHPEELGFAMQDIFASIYSDKNRESLASSLALIARIRPRQYRSIPIGEHCPSSLWIDVNAGHICWQPGALIDRERWIKLKSSWARPPVRIPMPVEISMELQKFLDANPEASTLADLFGGHLESLETSTKRFLRTISKTSHRITLGRLTNSYGRYLVKATRDEAYACVIGLDFRLGTVSNFHYCTFHASRINKITGEAYKSLGLSGDIYSPVVTTVGSRFIGKLHEVDSILKNSTQQAYDAFFSVKNRHDVASLTKAHLIISQSVLKLLSISSRSWRKSHASRLTKSLTLSRLEMILRLIP